MKFHDDGPLGTEVVTAKITAKDMLALTNEGLKAEERMYFCREAAIRLRATSFKEVGSVFHLTCEQAWREAEALWNAKPEHL